MFRTGLGRKLVLTFVILILFAQFISIAYISVFAIANGKFDSRDIYYSLLSLRLSKLSKTYEANASLPGYETYMEVLNGTYSNCSIHSWLLLIDCERSIFTWNITVLTNSLGENETANIKLNHIKEKLQTIKENLSVELKTIACNSGSNVANSTSSSFEGPKIPAFSLTLTFLTGFTMASFSS